MIWLQKIQPCHKLAHSSAVIACANVWHDLISILRPKRNLTRFALCTHKLLVKIGRVIMWPWTSFSFGDLGISDNWWNKIYALYVHKACKASCWYSYLNGKSYIDFLQRTRFGLRRTRMIRSCHKYVHDTTAELWCASIEDERITS